MTKVAAMYFRNFSSLFNLEDKTTSPNDACDIIQLDAKSSNANIRASAGLLMSSSRSLDASSEPTPVLMVLAESPDVVTKADVRDMVTNF